VTTESLIQRSENIVDKSDKKPEVGTTVEQQGKVETPAATNLIPTPDTSDKTSEVDWEKRYKDLQSFQSKRESELRTKVAELEAADSSFHAPTTPEEMEAFKEEHTNAYNAMLTIAREQATEATQGINAQLQTFEEDRMMNEYAQAQEVIRASHSDFSEVVNSTEFQAWAQNQKPHIQEWIFNNPNNPDLAITALDMYKASRDADTAHLEKETKKKASTRSAAESVGSSTAPTISDGKTIWTKSQIQALTSAEWSTHEADIEKAYLEGRVNFNS
jgi:hypothetical protein